MSSIKQVRQLQPNHLTFTRLSWENSVAIRSLLELIMVSSKSTIRQHHKSLESSTLRRELSPTHTLIRDLPWPRMMAKSFVTDLMKRRRNLSNCIQKEDLLRSSTSRHSTFLLGTLIVKSSYIGSRMKVAILK